MLLSALSGVPCVPEQEMSVTQWDSVLLKQQGFRRSMLSAAVRLALPRAVLVREPHDVPLVTVGEGAMTSEEACCCQMRSWHSSC